MAKRYYPKDHCRRNATAEERFQRWTVWNENGCRVWIGTKFKDGYGQMTWRKRVRRAHAVAWEESGRGPLPPGMLFRHTCDTPTCVNVDHLLIGTVADNSRDMVKRGRSLLGEKNPHSFLTDDQVRAIRSDPRMYKLIAADYGMNKSNVGHIKTRRNWGHVPD